MGTSRPGAGPRSKITRRERDVLEALCAPLAEGGVFVEPASIRSMAETLGVSDAAVKQHLLQLYDKFRIPEGEERRRTRLANKAVEAGSVGLGAKSSTGAPAPNEALLLGRKAAALRNWPRAFEELSRVPPASIEGSADDQELLGEAAVWSGDYETSMAARQRAYALHVHAGNASRAGLVALSLVVNYVMRASFAQASGWLAKARRHLDPSADGQPHGYLLVIDALFASFASELETATALASRALAFSEQIGDADLRALSLVIKGYSLCALGRREEARPLLDEAMSSATSGELGPLATGVVYCRTVCASLDSLDYERALEWTAAIERAGSDVCMAGFPGDCRAHRVSIYVMRGDWEAAEREAKKASEEASKLDLRHAGLAESEVGTVRLRSGDLAGAEAAFVRAHELGYSPQPGLSLLHLARGDNEGARSLIQGAVDQTPRGTPLRAKFLPALFEIAIANSDLTGAEATQKELSAIARLHSVPVLRAGAATAEGVLRLAQHDARGACDALQTAVSSWLEAGAPYETACARVELAQALVEAGDKAAAALEVGAARQVLTRLGAKPALARADRALQELR